MRIKDIEARIEDKLTFDRAKLPRFAAVKWVPRRSQFEATMLYAIAAEDKSKEGASRRQDIMESVQPTTLEVGAPWPFRRGMTVLAIFSDDDTHRVYAVQTLEELNGSPVVPPTRYTCRRGVDVVDFSAEVMHIDTFIDEIVDEWTLVAAGVSSAEEEKNDVVAYLEKLPDDYSVKQAAQDIAQDVHHDGEEDEEEEEPEAPVSGPQPAPAVVQEPPKEAPSP